MFSEIYMGPEKCLFAAWGYNSAAGVNENRGKPIVSAIGV